MAKRNKIILYTSKSYPCKIGGMEIYNYYLIQELAKTPDSKRFTVLSSCMAAGSDLVNVLPEKERIFVLRRYGLSTASTIFYYCFSKKMRWKEVAVVYLPYTSNFSYSAFPLLILKKILKVEYVVHIHSGGIMEWKPRWLLKSFFKNARNIAGVSVPIVEEYGEKTGREIKYLPPLLPFMESSKDKKTLRQQRGFDRFKNIIVFIGTIKALKAPETLLKAFKELGQDFIHQHQLGLVMVGDGPLRRQLENKYADMGSIVFEGTVPNAEIKDYYKLADAYVITSWFEGTSISLLEAMFNKLPCIGTNVTGIRDIIKPGVTGFLFEKDDYQGLSHTLREVFVDCSHAETVGKNAYEYYLVTFCYKDHLSQILEFIGL